MQETVLSLQEYLTALGVDEYTSAEQLAYYKQEHRKMYHREYSKKRRQKEIRLEITLSQAEYRKLKQFAQNRYRRKYLNRFVRECTFAYLEEESVDHNPEMTRELLQQIRAIGHNVNQVVHQLHRTKDYKNKNFYQQLKGQLDTLHNTVKIFLEKTPNLPEQLENLFEDVPESVHDFERFLTEMKTKHLGDDSQKHE